MSFGWFFKKDGRMTAVLCPGDVTSSNALWRTHSDNVNFRLLSFKNGNVLFVPDSAHYYFDQLFVTGKSLIKQGSTFEGESTLMDIVLECKARIEDNPWGYEPNENPRKRVGFFVHEDGRVWEALWSGFQLGYGFECMTRGCDWTFGALKFLHPTIDDEFIRRLPATYRLGDFNEKPGDPVVIDIASGEVTVMKEEKE